MSAEEIGFLHYRRNRLTAWLDSVIGVWAHHRILYSWRYELLCAIIERLRALETRVEIMDGATGRPVEVCPENGG